MTKKRLITKIEIEGLFDRGKAVLRQETYSRHQKSFGSALLLLLIFGGFGAHRFYLDKTWSAWLWPILFIPIVLGIASGALSPIYAVLILFAVIVELSVLPNAVKVYNRALHSQLERETEESA